MPFQASNVLKKKASESRLAVLSRQSSSEGDGSYNSLDEGSRAKEADPIKVLNREQKNAIFLTMTDFVNFGFSA